jgi:hypothetical protein
MTLPSSDKVVTEVHFSINFFLKRTMLEVLRNNIFKEMCLIGELEDQPMVC